MRSSIVCVTFLVYFCNCFAANPRSPVVVIRSRSETLQLRHFPDRQCTIFSRRNIQDQRPKLHALNFFHVKSHTLTHPPNLTIPSFAPDHLIPGMRAVL